MPSIKFLGKTIQLPRNRIARIAIGVGLIAGGSLGFLPILGFWMLPLGVIVLSADFPAVRRFRRRFQVWFTRWWQQTRWGKPKEQAGPQQTAHSELPPSST